MKNLTHDNYLLYAARNYQNPHCTSIEEFNKDCKTFIVARTLLRIHHKGRPIKFQLLLNHIIICTNLFGNEAAVDLFFFHCEKELWNYLVTVFDFLNILPPDQYQGIEKDSDLEQKLKEL